MSPDWCLHRIARGWLLPIVAAIGCLVASPDRARGLDDPSLDYRTITTSHFHVHYAERWRLFGERVARVAEEAHEILVPLLANEPRNRTHIVVDDSSDLANGSASTLGRNTIQILAQPPGPSSVLGYYDDWLRILVYHEYVHILHLDTSSGPTSVINWVLGNQLHPNAALPRWYIEGLAVWHESDRTGTGRTNSSLFRMWLRTAALSGEFFSLGRTTGQPFRWPQGTTPYLYGGFFMEYIADKHGGDALTRFNHVYGSQLVPFNLNQTLESITGETFHELWREWSAHVQAKTIGEQVAARARGGTEIEYITDGGGAHQDPVARPGTDQITYYASGLTSHAQFVATDATESASPEGLFEIEGADGSSDWTPDGDQLVYSRQSVEANVYRYYDLYIWSPERERHRRLTRGERARDPAISPDGRQLAYVRTKTGTTELVVCRLERSRLRACRPLVEAEGRGAQRWQQIADPAWSPDGERLVFSWWRLDRRHRDLWAYHFEAEDDTLSPITRDAAQDLAPTFGPDGMLYFSSDRTGIYNIYARDPTTGRTWQVSDVLRGVFDPEISSRGRWIYVSVYTSNGYELARLRRPTRFRDPAPSSDDSPNRRAYPDVETDDWRRGHYRPGRWLMPLRFEPNIGVLSSGAGFGGTLVGSDPVGHHRWRLSGAWLSGPAFTDHQANIGVDYRFGGFPVDLSLGAHYRERPRTRSLVAESRFVPFMESEYGGRLQVGYPVNRIDDRLSLSTSLEVNRTQFRDRPQTTPEPGDTTPREPEFGWSYRAGFSLSYTNLDRFRQSISVEEGYAAGLGLNVQRDLAGRPVDSVLFSYNARGYQPNPLWRRHVFGLELSGGLARSQGTPSRAFAIGGHRPQNILNSLLLRAPSGGFVLRGYPPGLLVGDQYQVWSASYRFPLLFFDRGFSTVPAFLGNLKGDVFVDAGGAFEGLLSDADFRTSAGAELVLGTQLGYYFGGQLRLGFARGFGEGGENEWYFLYVGGF